MARYEHLPIYREVFDLTVYIEQVTHGYHRQGNPAPGWEHQGIKERRIVARIVPKWAGFASREDSR